MADNLLQSALVSTHLWQPALDGLKAIETLLGRIQYRERFSHACVGASHPDAQKQLKNFSASLKGLRQVWVGPDTWLRLFMFMSAAQLTYLSL